MLTIREEQLEVFRRHRADGFEADAARHLLTFLPGPCNAVGGPIEMRAFVRDGIRRAAGHGVEETGAVLVFLECILQYGEHFERSPSGEWINRILGHPVLPGYVKVDAIRDRLQDDSRGRVLVRY